MIESLIGRIGDDGSIAVELEGRAGTFEPRTLRLEFLDGTGAILHQTSGWGSWHVRLNRIYGSGSSGQLVVTGDRFSGFMSYQNTDLTTRPERVRVNVVDIEEAVSAPMEATLQPPEPVSVAEGAVCDPFGLLNRCAEGTVCDTFDSRDRVAPTCVRPAATCPHDLPVLEGETQGSNADASDITYSSCTSSRGDLGREQGHAFVPSASGSYRFTVDEIDYGAATTLFVRRYCNLGIGTVSELACRHVTEVEDGAPFDLAVDLTAGETVFVFVEAWWANGGQYQLSVEAP